MPGSVGFILTSNVGQLVALMNDKGNTKNGFVKQLVVAQNHFLASNGSRKVWND